jgi:DNA-binding CsgD family transcriptional regulator
MSPLVGGRGAAERAGAFRLDEAVADVFGDLRLPSVLRRLLWHSRRLTGSVAGSVSLVDVSDGTYVKVAEYGDFCRLGGVFPLDEGATGRAYDRRRPVVIPDYGRLRTNHLASRDHEGPAAAIPIWWRGEVIAVNVAFTGPNGEFTHRTVDDLEALTQTAAAAIVRSAERLRPLRQRPDPAGPTVTDLTGAPATDPTAASSPADRAARSAADPAARSAVDRAARSAADPAARSAADRAARSAADRAASFAADPAAPSVADRVTRGPLPRFGAGPAVMPFTPREFEVLEVLRLGLTDREIATRLMLSSRTVEKHVGAIMRKTGTTNRTAAVVASLEQGWLASSRTRVSRYG